MTYYGNAGSSFRYENLRHRSFLSGEDVNVGAHHARIGHLTVVPINGMTRTGFIDMSDALMEREMTPCLQEIPQIGKILVGRASEVKRFFRVVVRRIIPGKKEDPTNWKVIVQILDSGVETILGKEDLRETTSDIMKFPVIAGDVILQGIPEEKKALILPSKYRKLVSNLKTPFRLEIVESGSLATGGVPIVKLESRSHRIMSLGRGTSLNREVLALAKWDWERMLEKGCRTDDDMLRKPNGEGLEILHHEMLQPLLPPSGEVEFTVLLCNEYTQFLAFPSEPRLALIQELEVLERQLELYCSKVVASPCFPKIGQVILLKHDGKWVRAARSSPEILLLLDHGIPVPYHHRLQELRLMPFCFAKVPALAVDCGLIDLPPCYDLSKEIITYIYETVLKPQSRHIFIMKSYDPEAGYFGVECPEIKADVEAKMAVSNANYANALKTLSLTLNETTVTPMDTTIDTEVGAAGDTIPKCDQ